MYYIVYHTAKQRGAIRFRYTAATTSPLKKNSKLHVSDIQSHTVKLQLNSKHTKKHQEQIIRAQSLESEQTFHDSNTDAKMNLSDADIANDIVSISTPRTENKTPAHNSAGDITIANSSNIVNSDVINEVTNGSSLTLSNTSPAIDKEVRDRVNTLNADNENDIKIFHR